MHVVYLHGFASSPDSSKAQYLSARLQERGVGYSCPDLNEPDFSTLTTTRMVDQVCDLVTTRLDAPVTLCGSSLGAFVALHAAERLGSSIDKMVWMAPALDFGQTPVPDLGEAGMRHWERTGWWSLTHYATNQPRRVHYELFRDAQRYDSFATTLTVPTLILQGRGDTVVDPRMVERFAANRPQTQLVMLDDDHQLGQSLERLWTEVAAFLE